ncbi:MAG: ABC transporter ATP-binding protein [Lachnospiraceae bacterium]|nr:ABC transporter ATP-binding protein [Lachnospiraceae bacterium]
MCKNTQENNHNSLKDIFQKMNHVIGINIKLCKWILPCNLLKHVIFAAVPYVGIVYSSLILNGLINDMQKNIIMKRVYQLVAVTFILTLLFHILDKVGNAMRDSIRYRIQTDIAEKALTLDYQDIEKQETMKILTAALEGEQSSGGIYWFSDKLGVLVGDIASVVYSFLVIYPLLHMEGKNSMSGIQEFLCSKWMMYIVFFLYLISMFLFMRISQKGNEKQYLVYEKSIDAVRKDKYFYREILSKYQMGKEIRLYHLKDILMRDMEFIWEEKCKVQEEKNDIQKKIRMLYQCVQTVLLLLAYVIVGLRGVNREISAADVVKYVSALIALSSSCQYLIEHFENVLLSVQYLHHYYEYLALRNNKDVGTKGIKDCVGGNYALPKIEIEFDHVYFRYPGSKEDSLKDINIKFHYGEKIALVGRNGAGKTTLILLLCRLYEPTKGRILLNGVDIKEFNYQEYRDLFGVVFQDFKLFSASIAENVASSREYNEKKVWDCLKKAGIGKRIKKMEQQIETPLYNVGVQGVEVSGGEAQKIAIARALYKDAPIVVMDEPTSALDPVSEYEIYSKFDTLVQNHMAIYISHRMSSCKFCTRIVVLDEGNVVEDGSHSELIQQNGIYATLWNVQAQNYQ